MLIQDHPLLIHEDVFFHKFKPYRHPQAANNVWGGLGLEAFGEDMALVRTLDVDRVWTVIDASDTDITIIAPGIRYVNRVVYLITRHRHYFAELEVEIPGDAPSLDPDSFASQLRKVNLIVRRQRECCRKLEEK